MMEYVGVSDRLKSNGWTVAQESRLVDGNTLILDIVAIRDQRAVIIEPTIVYENTPTSLQKGNKVKIQKYRPLSDVIKDEHGDDEVEFYGLAIGARGGWCTQNTKCLTSVGLHDIGLYALLCRYALRGTINMLRMFTDLRGQRRTWCPPLCGYYPYLYINNCVCFYLFFDLLIKYGVPVRCIY